VVAPVDNEPAVAPVPPIAVPEQRADAQAADRVAIDGSPEEDVLAFPLLRDEMQIGEQVVEDIGAIDGLACDFPAEFVALNPFAILLLRGEIERDLVGVPFERAYLLVFLHLPSIGHERVGVEIKQMIGHRDDGVVEKNNVYPRERIVFAESFDFLIGPAPAAKRRLELTSLVNIEHKVAHVATPFVMMFLIVSRALPRSSNVSNFRDGNRKLSIKELAAIVLQ
jgi:hypothetical protein